MLYLVYDCREMPCKLLIGGQMPLRTWIRLSPDDKVLYNVLFEGQVVDALGAVQVWIPAKP